MVDSLYHITADNVVYPQTCLVNTKLILVRDKHDRYWKLTPVDSIDIAIPFVIKSISRKEFEKLKEEMK